jgi:hypothetical protein
MSVLAAIELAAIIALAVVVHLIAKRHLRDERQKKRTNVAKQPYAFVGCFFVLICIGIGWFLASIDSVDLASSGARPASQENGIAQNSEPSGDLQDSAKLQKDAPPPTSESPQARNNYGDDRSPFCDKAGMQEGEWVRSETGEVVVLKSGICRPATKEELSKIISDEAQDSGE